MKKNLFTRLITIILCCAALLSLAACGDEVKENDGTTEMTQQESESNTEMQTEGNTVSTTETEVETETEKEENLILGDSVEYAESFTVSKVFGSDMVLQRNEKIRVWGWADESENGKKVTVEIMGQTADALIENGEWVAILNAPYEACAELGNDLLVYTDKMECRFKDVLIGDVFMVIGQSNVQYPIQSYLNSEPDLKWTLDELSYDSIIRINYNSNTDSTGYPVRGTTAVCKDVVTDNGWVLPDEDNILRLSAIGYFMAHQIVELTNNSIPVGIAQFSASGRPLSVFMPNELAEEYGTDQFDEAQGVYIGNYHTHVVTRYMYNHYLYPYEKMAIAGIVWYQGEAESAPALSKVFVERFTALMTYMRGTHNLINKDFPVFIVEFPTIYPKPEGAESWEYLNTGVIRAVEGNIPMSLENSYTAVCCDLWDDAQNSNNVHPYCKYEQAERVVALMDAVIYGGRTLDEATGPILESITESNGNKTFTLKFSNYGEGLTTADGSNIVKGFVAISKSFQIETRTQVTAEITAPDTIVVTCSRASAGVAYNAFPENFYGDQINLCDSYGNPAKAFWAKVD